MKDLNKPVSIDPMDLKNIGLSKWLIDKIMRMAGGTSGPPIGPLTPNFQTVTDNGPNTTNNFYLRDSDAEELVSFLNDIGVGAVIVNDPATGASIKISPEEIIMQNQDGHTVTLRGDNIDADYVHQQPAGDGTYGLSVNSIPFDDNGNIIIPIGGASNRVLAGGKVIWRGNYDYTVTAATYLINGIVYFSIDTDFSLTSADPALDRIDTFTLRNNMTANVLEGIPSSNPVSPTADPATEIQIGIAFIGAGTTQPVIAQDYIYTENTEWPGITSDPVTLDPNYAVNPMDGSLSISAVQPNNGDNIVFTRPTPIPSTPYNMLVFWFTGGGLAWTTDDKLRWQFTLGGVPVGNAVDVADHAYGVDSFTTQRQTIAVPLSLFALSGNIDGLTLTTVSDSSFDGDFMIDNMRLQYVDQPISSALWEASGQDIYNTNSGRIGMGTKNPSSFVDIVKSDIGTVFNEANSLGLRNLQPALLNAPQNSPAIVMQGQALNPFTGNSRTSKWRYYVRPSQTDPLTNVLFPASNFIFECDDSGALITAVQFGSNGSIYTYSGIRIEKEALNGRIFNPSNAIIYRSGNAVLQHELFQGAGDDLTGRCFWINNGNYIQKNASARLMDLTGDLDRPLMSVRTQGSIGFGTDDPDDHAIVDLTGTGKGLLLPRLTAAQVTGLNQRVVSYTVTNPGSGYQLPPNVAVANSSVGGERAYAYAVMGTGGNADKIDHLVVLEEGRGYPTVPIVTITPSTVPGFTGGSGGAATAVLGTSTLPAGLVFFNTTINAGAGGIQYIDGTGTLKTVATV